MNKFELINLSQKFVEEFKLFNIQLDYSLQSLNKIEDYLEANFKNNKPKRNSFFADDTESKTLAFGAYLGEVVRRNGNGVKWIVENVDSPLEFTLTTPDGATAFVVNKAFKRIFNGSEDNTYHFAFQLLKDLMKYEEEIPDDYFDADDLRIIKYQNSHIAHYSKSIKTNGNIIKTAIYVEGQWYFSGIDENDNDFEFLFLDEIKLMHPEIADLLVAKEKLIILRQDDGTYRTQSEYKSPFYDSNSFASHQGNMKLNSLQWTKFNLQSIAKSHGFFLLSFYLMIKVHWLFSILFIGSLLYIIWYWFMVRNRFMAGNVSPGKVIALNPTLLAVATDLSKSTGDYPILKIIKTSLPKEDNVMGKVIPTVALYNDNPHDYPFWAEFHPVPVIHGISDKKHIESITKNFSYSSDSPLEVALSKVQNRTEGVYKVDEASNDWAKFTHVDIAKGVSMEKPLS